MISWHKKDEIDGLWLLSNSELWCQIIRVINNRIAFLKGDCAWGDFSVSVPLARRRGPGSGSRIGSGEVEFTLGTQSLSTYPTESEFLSKAGSSLSIKKDLYNLWISIVDTVYDLINSDFSPVHDSVTDLYKPWKNSDWTEYSGIGTTPPERRELYKFWKPESVEYIRETLDTLIYAQHNSCIAEAKTFPGGGRRSFNSSDVTQTISYDAQVTNNGFGHYAHVPWYPEPVLVHDDCPTVYTDNRDLSKKYILYTELPVSLGGGGSYLVAGTLTGNTSEINTAGRLKTYTLNPVSNLNLFLPQYAISFRGDGNNIYIEPGLGGSNSWCVNEYGDPDFVNPATVNRKSLVFEDAELNYWGVKYSHIFADNATFHSMKFPDGDYRVTFFKNTNIFDDLFFRISAYQYVNDDYYSSWKVINDSPDGAIGPSIFSAGLASKFVNRRILNEEFSDWGTTIDLNTDIKKAPEILFLLKYSYKTDLDSWAAKSATTGTNISIVPNFTVDDPTLGTDIMLAYSQFYSELEWIRASSTPNDSATILP